MKYYIIFIILTLFFTWASLISAADYTPPGNLNGQGVFSIKNFTNITGIIRIVTINITATNFIGSGAMLYNINETDPKFIAENASLWKEAKNKYNATYHIYAYNQTTPAIFYADTTFLPFTDQRYNETIYINTKLLSYYLKNETYNKSQIDNNFSLYLLLTDQRYNETSFILNINNTLWDYINTNKDSWLSTYNESYENWEVNANQNVNLGSYNITANRGFLSLAWSYLTNLPNLIYGLWSSNNANNLLISNGTAIGYNETVLNNSIRIVASVFNDTSVINSINTTINIQNLGFYNKSQIDNNLSLYLLLTDQRYNETSLINSVNTTANIQALGFYTKSQVDNNLSLYLLLTDQRYNETSKITSVNTTINIQNLGFYNKSQVDNNLSLYLLLTDQRFNETNYINTIISNNNASWTSTYNATYHLWAYNQTTPAISYVDNIVTSNNASWSSTYNQTYHNFVIANASNYTTWWAGVSNWVSGWFIKSNSNLEFNETKLNSTIDKKLLGEYWFFYEESLVYGTSEGTLDLTRQADDYDTISYNLTEVVINGLLYYANTSANVSTDVNRICIRYKATGDNYAVSLWSTSLGTWEGYLTLGTDTIFKWACSDIRDSSDHLIDNKILMRIIHTGSASTMHRLFIDAMYVSSGYTPRIGNEVDPLSFHKNENLDNTGYNITADYFFGNGSELTGILTAETDPVWTANFSLGYYLNHTLAVFNLWGQWFYNQTIPAITDINNRFWNRTQSYNKTQIDTQIITNGSYFSTYNSTYAATTSAWNGNSSALLGCINNASYLSTYNETYAGLINNASYLSTYNATYASWSYNQTTATFNLYNSTWDNSFMNIWNYNQTTATYNLYNAIWSSTYNSTYAGSVNNESYLSTYNATYASWAYNQTIPSISYANLNFYNKSANLNLNAYNISTTGLSTFGAINITKNISIQTNNMFCLDGSACTKYIYYNGSNIIIQG